MQGQGSTQAEGAAPIEARDVWIETGQGRLYARQWLPARDVLPPVVLLHDSLGCVALWRGFPEALARTLGRRVIAYDRLGFGRSDPHPGPLDPAFVTLEAEQGFAALRAQLELESFVLMGHSVGGGMAVACAARHADGCRALITESAQAFVEDYTRDGVAQARIAFRDPAQLDRLRRYHGDKARWVLQAWTETRTADAFADWSLRATLPGVTCPVLALHGAQDEYGTARHPETICALAGGPCRMELLPGLRHVPHREDEARVLALVAQFLDAPPGR